MKFNGPAAGEPCDRNSSGVRVRHHILDNRAACLAGAWGHRSVTELRGFRGRNLTGDTSGDAGLSCRRQRQLIAAERQVSVTEN